MLRQLKDYDQSRFWQRLQSLSGDAHYAGDKEALAHLLASVRKVASRAAWISTQICRHMPQYTLHEERHFLNVLAIMDALVPDEVMLRLTPLECALPILAAYTHDLGMALPHEEYIALQDESTDIGKRFQSYRSRYDEELRQAERWRKEYEKLAHLPGDEAKKQAADCKLRADAINGHILASYLRETHTEDDSFGRLRKWLRDIREDVGDENLYRYGQFNYERSLALLGISHGRGANWLRKKLVDDGHDDSFFRLVSVGEEVNLAFSGLLLRLADIMDFDAGRAPRILFKHFGIENDHSILEWNKHQAIVGWKLKIDPAGHELPQLKYEAECVHPVHEKSIRVFAQWIDAELNAVRTELDAQQRHLRIADRERYKLHLAAKTDIVIRAVRDANTDQPKYIYHDLQFRLDQDELQQLLMGESLYGDPALCIRELLQNALDALELRELRLKMKRKGEAREPVDGFIHPTKKGWIINETGEEEELRVTLDWGTDEETGQQWLRVTDNGVGMTEEVIKNYFTQIGKSFYRSPEFNQERAAMKAAGEVVSPISIFGIGILSSFMIAERVQVKSNPGGLNMDRVPNDIMISGPGSLFWFHHGSRQRQGTEITLFLKSRFSMSHNTEQFAPGLRAHFGYNDGAARNFASGEIDPAFIAAAHAVWPKYPIVARTPVSDDIRIDEGLHQRQIASVDHRKLRYTAERFAFSLETVEGTVWADWSWEDRTGQKATGSRVRLWFPVSSADQSAGLPRDTDGQVGNLSQDELAALLETQLELRKQARILVRGMHVPEVEACASFVELAPNTGGRIWIDFCADAAPRLTADRRKALPPVEEDSWREVAVGVFSRMRQQLSEELRELDVRRVALVLSAFDFADRDGFVTAKTCPATFDFTKPFRSEEQPSPYAKFEFVYKRFMQAQEFLQRGQNDQLDRDGPLSQSLAKGQFRFGHHRIFQESRPESTPRAAVNACARALSRITGELRQGMERQPPAGMDGLDRRYFHDAAQRADRKFDEEFGSTFGTIPRSWQASLLQEAFKPTLSSSWAPLQLFCLEGEIGDAKLVGPGLVEFQLESDGKTVHFGDPEGASPLELVQRGYNLTSPMTAVPLGRLRRECGEWRSDRWYRPLGVAPFLLPALHDVWPAHAEFLQETFKVPHIYCLLPRFELWSKRFSDWTDEDWNDPENLSALWDLSGQLTGTAGQVLWARGTHDIQEMPKRGLPAPEFLKNNKA